MLKNVSTCMLLLVLIENGFRKSHAERKESELA